MNTKTIEERKKAKEAVLNYVEDIRSQWCEEGIETCSKLIDLLGKEEDTVIEIKTDEYAVYDGTDCGNYELVGEKFTIDTNKTIELILKDTKRLLDGSWSLPTVEGPYINMYHLLNQK